MSEENQTPVDTGTETPAEKTVENPELATAEEQEPDYKKKFSESSREAQRLLELQKEKDRLLAEKEAEIERLRLENESKLSGSYASPSEPLYPGFDLLSEEEQKNLVEYTNSLKKGVQQEIYKDPAIAFARESFNEKRWNDAFESVVNEFPELAETKADFKQKYFNKSNVPDNISDILKDLAKVHLFDRARDLGAMEARQKAEHIELERAGGGDKQPATRRSLEDWHRMAQENPQQFAKLSKEYNEDLASGRLK